MIVRPRSILLDAEALSALAAGERRMQAWATVARRTDSTLHASTITLAEVTDGTSRDVKVRRITNAVQLEVVTEAIGFRAGQLRAAASSVRLNARNLTVDSVVAATALTLAAPVVVLTGDRGDLSLLLVDSPVDVEVIS